MKNLTFDDKNVYGYETIAGGIVACPTWQSKSGTHTHITNTGIPAPEIFESRFLLDQFKQFKTVHVVIIKIECLKDIIMIGILSERRSTEHTQ